MEAEGAGLHSQAFPALARGPGTARSTLGELSDWPSSGRHYYGRKGLSEMGAVAGSTKGKMRSKETEATERAITLSTATLPELLRELLIRLGEDPEREGLRRTPERVAHSLEFLTRGNKQDPTAILNTALFTEHYDEMVIVRDIEMFSMCEHHMLPFFGKVHVAYLPNGKLLGLSKIPRLVDGFARRLQVQERLTTQIAEAIQSAIRPKGVGVVIQARHLCMMMRGVEKQHSAAVTSAMVGTFRTDGRTRDEFLTLLNDKQNGHNI
jgi:GTP cyclohydrolase IA